MKKVLAVFALATVSGMAADFTGYIIDEKCASKKEMRGNVACAEGCIKRGSPAVMVTDQPVFWKEIVADGVDLINTDDLAGAQRFLLSQSPPAKP